MWTIAGPVTDVTFGAERGVGAVLSGVASGGVLAANSDVADPGFAARLSRAGARWRVLAMPSRPEVIEVLDDALLLEVVRLGASDREKGAIGIAMSNGSASVVAVLPHDVFGHMRDAFAGSASVDGAQYRIEIDLSGADHDPTHAGDRRRYLTRDFSVSVSVRPIG